MTESTFTFLTPVVGTMRLGQWGEKFSTAQYLDFIYNCIQLGITDFDHADIYGHYTTEEEFGQALKEEPSLRSKIRLITKCGIKMISPNRPRHSIKSYDTSTSHIRQSVDNSLQYLHTDYIDLLLIHRPDILMNAEEIAECFAELQASGKVRHFGVSNFTVSQFALIDNLFPLTTNQLEASPLHLDPFHDGTFDQCQMKGISPMIWSPFRGGQIFQSANNPRISRIRKEGMILATKYDCTLDQLILAWLCKHPSYPVPVLGTSKINRIKLAIEAKNIQLSREDWYRLYIASTGEELA